MSVGISSFILVSLCIFSSVSAGPKKFRSEKVNYIYDKAVQHLHDQQRLRKLTGDLETYDNLYMSTKDLHSGGKMSELNKELGKMDKKLITLLEKYDLEQTVQAFKQKIKHRNEYDVEDDNMEHLRSDKFADERLQKLWLAASEGKFTDSELIEFHKELKEVERKVAVYEDVLQQFNKVPAENSIHSDENEQITEKNRKLKEAHKHVNDHIDQLSEKISTEVSNPFENEKVKKMWKLAQTDGNFSAHDMQVLKDELVHFDKQMKKLAFRKSELDEMRVGREKEGKTTLEHLEGTELEAKHEKMERKLRKLEKYLQTKIVHSEL